MVIRRPSPEVIAARKWEIARRYEAKPKVGKRSRSMAAIRLAELMRWLDDAYGAGAELEPSEQSILIARVFAHHLASLPDSARRIDAWFRVYSPWIELRDREYLIREATSQPLKWSADKLAWKIRLTDATRTRLKITTIGAIDCNREQRAKRRHDARIQRQRAKRAAKRLKPTI